MTSMKPKLVVRDADAAIEYYERVFGATVAERYTLGGSVVFAALDLLGARISLKDADDHDLSPDTLGRPGVVLDVTTDDPDTLAERMLSAGGVVVFEVADQPYGGRGGRVRDPFGHEWLLQTEIPLSPEEVQRRLDAMAGG